MTSVQLTLICPLAVEQRLIDTLMNTPGSSVFFSHPVHNHGLPAQTLSTDEQVLGRRRQTQIQVLLRPDDLDLVLDSIQRAVPDAGIRYWTTMMHADGELS